MPAFVKAFFAWLARALPFVKSAAETVAPEIQREIDKILAEAKSKTDTLKASNSVAAIKKQMEDDVKAVRETAEHHVLLIQQLAQSKIADTRKLLPDVQVYLPPAPAPAS